MRHHEVKCIPHVIDGLRQAISMMGPGIINVVAGEPEEDTIKILVYEAPTELIKGPLDGSEVFYGYTLRPNVMSSYVNIIDAVYINNEDGLIFRIECTSKDDSRVNMIIEVHGDPPDDVRIGQKYDTLSEEYTAVQADDTIIAVLK
jgi:hypothetical protein